MAHKYDLGLARSSLVACNHGLVWQLVVSHSVKKRDQGVYHSLVFPLNGAKQGTPLPLVDPIN